MEVTFSKQWIHFLLSERWPPTSTILQTQMTTDWNKKLKVCKLFKKAVRHCGIDVYDYLLSCWLLDKNLCLSYVCKLNMKPEFRLTYHKHWKQIKNKIQTKITVPIVFCSNYKQHRSTQYSHITRYYHITTDIRLKKNLWCKIIDTIN